MVVVVVVVSWSLGLWPQVSSLWPLVSSLWPQVSSLWPLVSSLFHFFLIFAEYQK